MKAFRAVSVAIGLGALVALAGCGDKKDYGDVAADSIDQMEAAAGSVVPSDSVSVLQYWFNIGVDTLDAEGRGSISLQSGDRDYVFIVDGTTVEVGVPANDTTIIVDVSGWEPGSYEYHTRTDSGEVDHGVIVVE